MTAYYTGMIYLTCFAMGIMALIVHSSDWLDREQPPDQIVQPDRNGKKRRQKPFQRLSRKRYRRHQNSRKRKNV